MGWTRAEQGIRMLVYLVAFGVVIAALGGLTGLRTRSVAASSDSTEVSVGYAQVTRPGIATPFSVDIVGAHGADLPSRLAVRVASDYLAMFDENGLDPEPDATSADGTFDISRFEVDPGATRLHIDFDARLQPNIHSGVTGSVRVVAPGADPVEVEFRTWVWP